MFLQIVYNIRVYIQLRITLSGFIFLNLEFMNISKTNNYNMHTDLGWYFIKLKWFQYTPLLNQIYNHHFELEQASHYYLCIQKIAPQLLPFNLKIFIACSIFMTKNTLHIFNRWWKISKAYNMYLWNSNVAYILLDELCKMF